MADRRKAEIAPPRSRRGDELGLRRALGDRMLPLLVAAMSFLAALALAGALAAASLAAHWQEGAALAVTVQVPQPDAMLPRRGEAPEETRLDAVLRVLRGNKDVASARPLSPRELSDLLRPWLGVAADSAALPLPAVIEVHLAPNPDEAALGASLSATAPGTLAESHGVWVGRLSVLALSLQACAWLALLVVALVAAAVVMVATRSGLASRRDAIEIVHGLGATDGAIAGHFARRITRLAALGGLGGAAAALPVLFALTNMAAPFMTGSASTTPFGAFSLGQPIWVLLPLLPVSAGIIGFLTAQATVRRWLRSLP
jgi:cell division transport system permease protein